MENETKYNFQPILLSALTLALVLCWYKIFSAYNPDKSAGLYAALMFPVFFVTCFIFPKAFTMVSGVPAIVLTNDYFIDNIRGLFIEWHDIMEMRFSSGGQRHRPNLIINLKQPEKYFNTPVKSITYKLRQLYTANDILIPLDLISGNNEEIFQMARAYWSKHDLKSVD